LAQEMAGGFCPAKRRLWACLGPLLGRPMGEPR